MQELLQEEAKQILISMTQRGMRFDGSANDGKGALIFKDGLPDEFRSAYVAIGSIVNGQAINSFATSKRGRAERYEIVNENIVKQMCGYCSTSQRERA